MPVAEPSQDPWSTPNDLDRPRLNPSLTHHGYRHLVLLAEQLADEAKIAAPELTVDMGCGSMPYRQLFPGMCLGIDLSSSHGRPACFGASEAMPLRDECADLVVSTQQLEHVNDPLAVISEARRLLRPGGTLLLSTHGNWPHHPDPQDLWRWTEEGLLRVVGSAGLTIDRVHRQGELFTTAILFATYPIGALRRKGPAVLRILAGATLLVLNALCSPLDAILRLAGARHYASPSHLVVARRPWE